MAAKILSPYETLPKKNFWRTGVAEKHPSTVSNLYRKRFEIGYEDRITTAGSCFAQHINRRLRRNGFNVNDFEPAPPGLGGEAAAKFGYGLFSARYGNIYVPRHFLQLLREATGDFTPKNQIWKKDGRFYDALRPSVDPNGLESAEEVESSRASHLGHLRRLIESTDVLIFTFGLTEAWRHKSSDTIFPTCPGTVAGRFNENIHEFKDFTFNEILEDFREIMAILEQSNSGIRFLLTVSPVPLTATAKRHHVLCATTYSKSVLRAVAGQLYSDFENVDYFPSYEIIASHFSRGFYYDNNLRTVNRSGVDKVMRMFFEAHEPRSIEHEAKAAVDADPRKSDPDEMDEAVCDEEMLEKFGS